MALQSCYFPLIPRTERRLHLRLMADGETLDFDTPNPSYATGFPVWKAEPLPQSRTVAGVEITLRSLRAGVTESDSAASNWVVIPEVECRIGGQRIEKGPHYRVSFSDLSGNRWNDTAIFSQPVWKLRIVVTGILNVYVGHDKPYTAEFFVKPPAPPAGR